MDFTTAIESSGLNVALQASGRSLLTQEPADFHIEVSKIELVSPGLFSFTHCCENSFNMYPKPNDNGHPLSPWKFDIGPMALNLGWTLRSIFQEEYSSSGLLFVDVFGTTFYEADNITPCAFSGKAVANGRLAARRLLATKGDSRLQAMKFTGPAHQQRRGQLYDALMSPFEKFFELYQI